MKSSNSTARMRIGIDIDETIAATFFHIVPHIREHCCADFTWEDFTYHDMWENPKLHLTKADTIRIWDEWWISYGHLVPTVEGSIEGIRTLQSYGLELFAITARNEEKRRDLTESWVHQAFPGVFQDLRFTSHTSDHPKTKSSVCKELGIRLMVDDNLDYALELANNNITTLVLEKPWNQHRTETHPNIIRVRHWDDIPPIILQHVHAS